MNKAYLLIGGNLGNRLKNLELALHAIKKQAGKIVKQSSIYETAAWGNTDQPAFYNQALCVETKLAADDLLACLLDIEEGLGRKRGEKFGPRIIDIDILFLNDEIHQTPILSIPHPQLQNRRFVLVPLQEIAPRLIHPTLNKSVKELLKICTDTLAVKKLDC